MKTEGGGALYLPDTFLMKYFGQNTFSEQGTFRNRLVMGFDTLPRSPGNITLHQTHIYTTGLQFFAWEKSPSLVILLGGFCSQMSSKCQ